MRCGSTRRATGRRGARCGPGRGRRAPPAFSWLLLALLPVASAWAQRVAPAALPTGLVQKSGTALVYSAPAVDPKTGRTTATLTQTDAANVVSWDRFDIGAAARLNIVQPSANAVLLNKVDGGAFENRTVIEGVLSANGRVYLYNPNGIVFGRTATVDTAALIASSLKFDEQRVTLGLLQPRSTPLLAADATAGAVPGAVVVEGDAGGRAALLGANGGLLMLAAPQVRNAGQLSAPDGQVVLAAGSKVYLAAPQVTQTGTSLRGLLVEVSNDDLARLPTAGERSAENAAGGRIDVAHGNATMIGYAVNQNGVVSASTSVTLNGSIYLLARDQTTKATDVSALVPGRTGPLTLGPDSVTQVLPDSADTATINASATFNRSEVRLDGADIQLKARAAIVANGGNVTATARRIDLTGTAAPIDPRQDLYRVDLAEGSRIDVSGSSGTLLAMESNVITVELRGTELADNVLLRNSPLYGSKVQIDVRKGTPVANVQGWLDLVGHGLGEVNAGGGKVSLSADGAVVQRTGSTINVDGGWVDYRPGHVNTTQLQVDGKTVDIGAASAGVAYTSTLSLPDSSANLEAGYRQGASAGSVTLNAPIVVMQGTLSGQAQAGRLQRDPSAANYPQGGQLQIGNYVVADQNGRASTSSEVDAGFIGKLVLGSGVATAAGSTARAQPPAPDAPFSAAVADQRLLAGELDLDTAALVQAGFSRLVAATAGSLAVSAPVALPAGGKLWLATGSSPVTLDGQAVAGGPISVAAPISVPAGSVVMTASKALDVAPGVAIDTAGRWVNDAAATGSPRSAAGDPVEATAVKGGDIRVYANRLTLGDDSRLDVSAGAWLNTGGNLKQGTAGNIVAQAVPENKDTAPAKGVLRVGEGVHFVGQGFGGVGAGVGLGGSLSLTGRSVRLGPTASGLTADDLSLGADFFQTGGFTRYDIAANVDLGVAAGTAITPRATAWLLPADAAAHASGRLADLASAVLFDLAGPSRVRASASLALRAPAQKLATAGRLLVDTGASIALDPGASLSLTAGRQVTVLGGLNAPAGSLLVGLSTDDTAPLFTERSIWFGSAARIRAGGSLDRLYTDGNGVSSGEVLAGGTIQVGTLLQGQLVAARGYVVAQAGSLFAVDGVSGNGLSLRSASGVGAPQTVASAGGSIEIRAREGLLLAGSFSGRGGGSSAPGGSLTLALEGGNSAGNANDLSITTKAPVRGVVPSGLSANGAMFDVATGQLLGDGTADGIESRLDGQGWIMASSFASGGFGRLTFKSGQVLSFGLGGAPLTLAAGDALVLDAPVLKADHTTKATEGTPASGNTLTLDARYVQLGNADLLNQAPDTATSGKALLRADATTVDLIGHAATTGFGSVTLNAAGDIRLVGVSASDADGNSTGHATGRFATVGALALASAQTYPTTLSEFTLAVAGVSGDASSGTLAFSASGGAAQDVLSAAGSVTALAPHIVQGGRLLAPFGQITLGNLDTAVDPIVTADLSYRPGSLTSVAGSGVVPLGTVLNGSVPTASDWQVSLTDGTTVSLKQDPAAVQAAGGHPERSLPAKAIVSLATTVNAARGAVLDVSGGGALYAYGFTPGRGGSRDVLSATTPGKPTTFAIVPSFHGAVAPIDGDYGSDGGLKPGDSVTLSAAPGLAAGTYTLLPAHYALLPGAFAISVASSTRDLPTSANTTLADGTLLVSGRFAQSGSGTRDARTQGFLLQSGTVLRSRSEFDPYDATTYFTAKAAALGVVAPERPVDGGRLAFDARATGAGALAFDATLKLGAASGGRAGALEVAAPQIEVVATRGSGSQSAVHLVAGELTALGADSLTLGALHLSSADGSTLAVRSSQVTVDNDAAHPLAAPELLLAATDRLSLGAGALLQAETAPARAPQDIAVAGAGALLRAGGGAAVAVNRLASSNSSGSGALEVAPGARVAATGALYLDATSRMTLDGTLAPAAGAAIGLGAPDISLGDAVPDSVLAGRTLHLGSAALAAFGALGSLSLDAHGTLVNAWGDVALGTPTLGLLSIRAAGLLGHGGTLQAQAQTLRLSGSDGTTPSAATATRGTLALSAGALDFGGGHFALLGFDSSTLDAARSVTATGQTGALTADGALTLNAGAITTAAGAAATIAAAGALTLGTGGHADPGSVGGLGGQLQFTGASITSSARVLAPSGTLALTAGGLLDVAGGTLSAAGRTVAIGGQTAYAPAGSVRLQGADVRVAQGAVVDVSATGADAGRLQVQAAGTADLQGTLRGAAATAPGGAVPQQGQFTLAAAGAGSADDFALLNQRLNDAGFTAARHLRYAAGDVVLNGNARVQARDVDIAVDDGNILVSGNSVIDASGDKGGRIALHAAQADATGANGRVTLADSAVLRAVGTATASGAAGSAGNGGTVEIGATNADGSAPATVDGGASLRLAGGTIDVSGSAADRAGSVLLRAPRVAGGRDVAVSSFATTVTGSAATVVEAVASYSGQTVSAEADAAGNLDAGTNGRMFADAKAFGQAAAAVRSRLNRSDVAVRAGVEVRSAGDLTVSVNEFDANAANRGWNLADWRFDGQPVNLTLRAAGNLTVLGAISDGFSHASGSTLAMPDWTLAGGDSASLRLVAGADLAVAQPLAVNATGSGDLHLGFAARTPQSAAPLTASDAPVSLVRTGNGRIDVAAGRDVVLDMAPFYTVHSSDPTVNGTPAVPDARFSDGTFKVSVFAASLYTAGSADASAPAVNLKKAALTSPLDTHYGAVPDTASAASFGQHGGAVTLTAGRDVVGAHHLGADWFHLNADYIPADGSSPAVPATVALLPRTPSALVDTWLFRQGRSTVGANGQVTPELLSDGSTLGTAWWSRTDRFNGGVATLGGGDLSVGAGRHVTDLNASVATSAYTTAAGSLREQGGGDLGVRAGGDIQGGAFYVQKGAGTLRADGSIAAGPASAYVYQGPADAKVTPLAPLAPVIALGDASVSLTAGHDLAVAAAYNPTQTEQSAANVPLTTASNFNPLLSTGWDAEYRQRYAQYTAFSTYGADSVLSLTALGGSTTLSNDIGALATNRTAVEQFEGQTHPVGIPDVLGQITGVRLAYALAPGRVSAASLSGDLTSANGFALAPSAHGQLSLLAAGSIHLANSSVSGISNGPLRMLDNDPSSLSTSAAPRPLTETDIAVLDGSAVGIAGHTAGGLHAADPVPVVLAAGRGDIVGDATAAATLVLPKAATISAGRDIRDLGLRVQQLGEADLTQVSAGRDIVDTTQSLNNGATTSSVAHVVTGAGQVEFDAGRHVDFGNGSGLVTRGNLDNPYLPQGGAAVRIVAGGVQPDFARYVAFAKAWGSPADIGDAAALAELTAWLRPRVATLGDTVSADQAWGAFQGLAADPAARADRQAYLDAHPALAARMAARAMAADEALAAGREAQLLAAFFTTLVETSHLGRKDADGKVIEASLQPFDAAIASLFPGRSAATAGDISVFASQVKTEQGGAIDLLAPSGSVYAGLTVGIDNKKKYEEGLFTIGGGAVRALVRQDFLVNQGRVFTLAGGDISLVSQQADIDAGRGAKTASSAPPPLITIDANGNIKVDVSGSISGSGIATLRTRADQPASNVYAIAPRGVFDAGDAGVRSTGSVEVVAPQVRNADNISAGGAVHGADGGTAPVVPVATPSAPASSTPSADDAAKAATGAGAGQANLALSVETLGYGPEGDDEDPHNPNGKKKRKP